MKAIVLSHDVDRVRKTFQYITGFIRGMINWDLYKIYYQFRSINLNLAQNPYWNFKKIIEIENEMKVKSTFFFLNESIRFSLSPNSWPLAFGRYKIQNIKIANIYF